MTLPNEKLEHSNWYHMLGGWYRILDGLGRILSFGFCQPDHTFQYCLRTLHEKFTAEEGQDENDD